jgi:uncharacterized protein with FMN-binding domain
MLRIKRVVVILVFTAASLYFTSCKTLEEIDRLTIENISIREVKDGNYQSYQNYFPVTAEVWVSVEDGEITDLKLLKHSHGPNHGADSIVDRVMAKQSLQVDAVSGATYSSKVVLKAIESALKQGL